MWRGACERHLGGRDDVFGELYEHVACVRARARGSDLVEPIALHEAPPDPAAVGRDEGEGHRAADQERVHAFDEGADRVELVRHLRTPQHRDVRAIRLVEQAAERLDLRLDQPAGDGGSAVLEVPRWQRRHRRVCSVDRPERVVHVDVRERSELGREPFVVALLAWIEPEVLEQHHITRPRALAGRRGLAPDDHTRREDVPTEELTQPASDRC